MKAWERDGEKNPWYTVSSPTQLQSPFQENRRRAKGCASGLCNNENINMEGASWDFIVLRMDNTYES